MQSYQNLNFDGFESLWVGTCPECGAEVEGEEPEQLRCLRADAGAGGGGGVAAVTGEVAQYTY